MPFRIPALLLASALAWGPAGAREDTAPDIRITDAERFYEIYDRSSGRPSAEELQRDYLDRGSPGLLHLARVRRVSGASIAAAVAAKPAIYRNARACLEVLPRVKQRVAKAMMKFKQLYPAAEFPVITVAVSHTKPVGIADPQGVQIGLEALCATRYMNPDNESRFVHVIVHEFVHSQQRGAVIAKPEPTNLEQALLEGGAEFVTELVSSSPGNLGPFTLARGQEEDIESGFMETMASTDLSRWFFNGSNEQPGDLGYWVGYRIVRSTFRKAGDKRAVLARILSIDDASAFLAESGWQPSPAP